MSQADENEKHLHNFNISGQDSRRIAELHLTAITQLIYFCEIDLVKFILKSRYLENSELKYFQHHLWSKDFEDT